MAWYDLFARFYDLGLEGLYRPPRTEAVAALQLDSASVVLDLATGTGQNLPLLFGADVAHVVGVDFSAGMLAQAARRAHVGGWGERLTLLERDAREVRAADLQTPSGPPNRMICTLGLSVIPDWERVLRHTLSVLQPGSRVVLMDVYMERWVPQSTVVTWMAQADLRRRIWEVLESETTAYERRVLPGSPHVHGGQLWLASGTTARP